MIKDTIRKEINKALLEIYQDKFSKLDEIPLFSIDSTTEKFVNYETNVAMKISK